MKFDPGHIDVIIEGTGEYGELADGLCTVVDGGASEGGEQEGGYGVGGQATAIDADGREYAGQEDESDIGPEGGAGIDCLVGSELIDGDAIKGGGDQGDDDHDKGGPVFSEYDAKGGDGLGLKDLVGAGSEFIGEAAHSDGGDQEQEHPGSQGEEGVEGGIAVVEQVVVEDEEGKSVHDQEGADGEVSGETGEELSEFFFTNGPHGG